MERVKDELAEIVIVMLYQGTLFCWVDIERLEEILNLLYKAMEIPKQQVKIAGPTGVTVVRSDYIQGFYSRRPSEAVQEEYHKQMIALQTRAVKAVEKCVDEATKGDEWKDGPKSPDNGG